MSSKKLPPHFFQRDDVVLIAKELIGTYLYTRIGDDPITGGMITETEAYAGIEDRASHAYSERRTKRTSTLYEKGGITYIYLCYGLHTLLNIVTNETDIPHGILIRGLLPIKGVEVMKQRRKDKTPLASGPGTLTQALGITRSDNAKPVTSSTLWLEPRSEDFDESFIVTTPRIGIDYAKEDALLPYRFLYKKPLP